MDSKLIDRSSEFVAPIRQKVMRNALASALSVPRALSKSLEGNAPRNDRAVALDYQTHRFLKLLHRLKRRGLHEHGVQGARALYEEATRGMDFPLRNDVRIQESSVELPGRNLALRIYWPNAIRCDGAIAFLHGGGFVVGSPQGYDGVCSRIAAQIGAPVFSIDYRLAPEHPFPAATLDVYEAFQHLADEYQSRGIDKNRWAVMGDSAGGNLATVLCQQAIARDATLPKIQALIYPACDHSERYPSYRHFQAGFYLEVQTMLWFSRNYLQGEDLDIEDPRISPIRFAQPEKMPTTLIITAGFDPLRDEGEAFARRLASRGVDVLHRSAEDLIHGFINMGGVIERAQEEIDRMCEEVANVLRR